MQTKHTFLGKMRNYHIIYIVTHKRREYNMSATSDITLRKINLNDIENIIKDKYYKVILKNKKSFEFDKDELYSLLEQMKD